MMDAFYFSTNPFLPVPILQLHTGAELHSACNIHQTRRHCGTLSDWIVIGQPCRLNTSSTVRHVLCRFGLDNNVLVVPAVIVQHVDSSEGSGPSRSTLASIYGPTGRVVDLIGSGASGCFTSWHPLHDLRCFHGSVYAWPTYIALQRLLGAYYVQVSIMFQC